LIKLKKMKNYSGRRLCTGILQEYRIPKGFRAFTLRKGRDPPQGDSAKIAAS
jgi:hypothetical protein